MDIPLKALLEKNGIHADVMTQFTNEGCDSIELFSEWSYTDIEMIAALLTPTSQKDSAPQRARLKLAWKTAKAMCDKKIKRIVEGGVADEDPDEPLDPGVQNSLEEAWSKAWSWPRLPAHLMAADEILGRLHREFLRRKPTLFTISKLRTIASTHKGGTPKKRRVAPGVELTIGDDTEGDISTASVLAFFNALEILTNTWSVAGIFEVEVDGTKTKFAPWPDMVFYLKDIRKRAESLTTHFTDPSVAAFLENREEAWRIKIIELVRGEEKLTWGAAILKVTKDHTHIWQEERESLVPKVRPSTLPAMSSGDNASQARTPKGKGKGGKGKGKGKDKAGLPSVINPPGTSAKRWSTVSKDQFGKWICKKYNDKRGCTTPCPDGCIHCCDVQLHTSKGCWATNHTRSTHDPERHGRPLVNPRVR